MPLLGVAAFAVAALRPQLSPAVEPSAPDPFHPTYGAPHPATDDSPDTRTFFAIEGGYSSTGFGVGLGARIGTAFANGLSVAASVTYHPLQTYSEQVNTVPPVVVKHAGTMGYTGVELGYDLRVRSVLLRPYVGAGFADAWGQDGSRLGAAGWGGVQASYELKETNQFVGVDARGTATTAVGAEAASCLEVFLVYGVMLESAGTRYQ